MKYQVWIDARRPLDLQQVGSILAHEVDDRLYAESIAEAAGSSVMESAYRKIFTFFGHHGVLLSVRVCAADAGPTPNGSSGTGATGWTASAGGGSSSGGNGGAGGAAVWDGYRWVLVGGGGGSGPSHGVGGGGGGNQCPTCHAFGGHHMDHCRALRGVIK